MTFLRGVRDTIITYQVLAAIATGPQVATPVVIQLTQLPLEF